MLIYEHFERQGFRAIAPSHELRGALMKLARPRFLRTLGPFLIDWCLIVLAAAAVLQVSLWLVPLAIIVIGSRQRALSNLVHDASHGNLARWHVQNDALADWLGALPMFDTVRYYRRSHVQHHGHLGSLRDPDSLGHLRYGYDDRKPTTGSAAMIYLDLVLNLASWKDSVVGNFFTLKKKESILVLSWWLGALLLLSAVSSPTLALTFVSLWILSRCTAFHGIRIIAEFLDHSGLPTGSIVGFSRNLPPRGLMRLVVHPHQDTYHLVHHLVPNVPHYNLPRAHDLLCLSPGYREAHHCDGYFKGRHSAIDCWMGRCHKGGLL